MTSQLLTVTTNQPLNTNLTRSGLLAVGYDLTMGFLALPNWYYLLDTTDDRSGTIITPYGLLTVAYNQSKR